MDNNMHPHVLIKVEGASKRSDIQFLKDYIACLCKRGLTFHRIYTKLNDRNFVDEEGYSQVKLIGTNFGELPGMTCVDVALELNKLMHCNVYIVLV